SLPFGHRDDAQLRRLLANPLTLGPALVALLAPSVPLPALVPHDLTAIERPKEDLAHGGRGPRLDAPAPARGRRGDTVRVERVGDALIAEALRAEGEDTAHRGGLGVVHSAHDMAPGAAVALDGHVVIAESHAAGDVPR